MNFCNDLPIWQIIVDSGLFVLIWLVQLIIYPSFRYTTEEFFIQWHSRYTALMGLIVTPFMLIQAGMEVSVLLLCQLRWERVVPILLIWLATFTFSVPCHRQLHQGGKDFATITRLIVTNWIRTLLWSLLFLQTSIAGLNP